MMSPTMRMQRQRRSIDPAFAGMWLAAVCAVVLAVAAPAMAQSGNAHTWNFGDAEVLQRGDVELENYQRVGADDDDGLLSLKPYENSLVERQRVIQGSVTVTFNGRPGYYTLVTQVQDESDGTSGYQIHVDGEEVDAFKADGIFVTYWRHHETPHVQLKRGSRIKIVGTVGGTEFARIGKLTARPGEPPRDGGGPTPQVTETDYSTNYVRLGDVHDVPEAHELIPHPTSNWGPQGRHDSRHLFAAEAGDTFVAYTASNSPRHGVQSEWRVTGVGERADRVVAEGEVDVPPDGRRKITFEVPYTGVFELKVEGALQQQSHPLMRDASNFIEGGGHFFVPQGTRAFKVNTTSLGDRDVEVVVKNPTGEITYRRTLPSRSEVIVPVPREHAGETWWIDGRGNTAEIKLAGVPALLSLLPADLLVPRETIQRVNPQARGDARSDRWHPQIDLGATASDAPAVTLVGDGNAQAVIVTAGDSQEAADNARLLQQCIERITGAKLAIQSSAAEGKATLWLGTADQARQQDIELPDDFDSINPEGFLMRSSADRLVLVGRTEHGLEPAARTLLMKLGVRWYFPGELWEVVPAGATLEVAVDQVQEPDYIRRHISYGQRTSSGLMNEFYEWYDANRMGSALNGSIHHSYESFVPRKHYNEHPEWFALKDTDGDGIGDTRTPNQPCTTHPEVVKMFQASAKRKLANNPDIDLLPVSPNDGTPNMCRCERCRSVGSYSDCAWLIAHQVANAVRDEHPDVYIGFYAYGRTSPPPTLDREADPRLVADLATAFDWQTDLPEMLEGWPRYVGWMGVRDYYAITTWGGNLPHKGAFVHEVARELPMYYDHGARAISAESCAAWGGSGLPMYVASQLMWNVNADVSALTERFYKDAFGAAAPQARRFYERWERGDVLSDRTIKLTLLDLREGMDAAEHRVHAHRLAALALYVHTLKVFRDFDELDTSDQSEAFSNMVERGERFLWRSHRLGLYHMRNVVGGSMRSGWPYFTTEEVRRIIERDLEDLKDTPALEITTEFSRDLVPLPGNVPTPAPTQTLGDIAGTEDEETEPRWLWDRATLWALVPDDGELVLALRPGERDKTANVTWRHVDDAPEAAQQRTIDLSGQAEWSGELATDRPGLYRITVKAEHFRLESPARWVIDVSRDLGDNEQWRSMAREQPWYFYVPHDTEGFVMTAHSLGPRAVSAKLADASRSHFDTLESDDSARWTYRVPRERTGQVWAVGLSTLRLQSFSLWGVPPYIATSPEKMLVPRDALPE